MLNDRPPTVFIVDDDSAMRALLQAQVQPLELAVEVFASAIEFLAKYDPEQPGCLITDEQMPMMSGLQLQQELVRQNVPLPVILISGGADARMAVAAMKEDAVQVLKKPFQCRELLESIVSALEIDSARRTERASRAAIQSQYAELTSREREVLDLVASGLANKQMARHLDLSEKTIEFHRSKLMKKLQVRSVAELIRFALAVASDEPTEN